VSFHSVCSGQLLADNTTQGHGDEDGDGNGDGDGKFIHLKPIRGVCVTDLI
jgi:hypothetical protein